MKTHTEYLNQLMKNRLRILNIVGICTFISVSSYFYLPRNYKVTTTIALQTQYFQLPLVSSFMPETYDAAELRAKREAIISLALNQKFLIEIAEKYKLIKDPNNSHDLELLSKKFEVVSNGQGSFMVNFSAKDANLAYQVLQDFLNHLRVVMTEERRSTLLNLHDAIQEQLESISVGKKGESTNAIYSVRPDLVQRRIERIQQEIITLKNSYSERHPRIAALKEQLVQLSQWNKPMGEVSNAGEKRDVFNGMEVDASSKELFDDLIKKYRYLEVVIYMDQQSKDQYLSFLKEPFVPDTPTWPKLPLLLLWGMAVGFLLGSVRVLTKAWPVVIPQPINPVEKVDI